MSTTETISESVITEDELSLQDIKKFFIPFKGQGKRVIILFALPVLIFASIGYLAAVTSPKEYDAKCILITDQVASSGTGALQGLASLAGLVAPTSGGGSDLGADLYPLILSNKPFLIELSKESLFLNKQHKTVTFEQYFQRDIKGNIIARISNAIFHPSTIKEVFNNSDILAKQARLSSQDTTGKAGFADLFFSNEAFISELTLENKKMIGIFSQRIKFVQTGKLITLSVKMPEAELSAQATKIVLNLLIKYITKFKVGKQLETIRWLEARTAESEIKYKLSQQRVAGFKDNNYHVIFESVQSKEQQLQNEFVLAFGVYNQFVTQLDQAKIQLKKDTPLFTVVEPVYVPDAISSDPNKLIVSYATTGFMIGLLFVVFLYGRIFYRSKLKRQIKISQ